LEICRRHGIEYRVERLEFGGRDEVMDWIDRNQMARRNLTPDQFTLLLGRLYNRKKKAVGFQGPGPGRSKTLAHFEPMFSTAEKLATEYGVSANTVKRAGAFAKELEETPELAEAVKEGKPILKVKRALKEKRRENRRRRNRIKVKSAKNVSEAIKQAKFATIVIDPPWDWEDEGDVNQMGRAKPDYSTLSFDELKRLPVAELADQDCHLYLWITNRSLPKGFPLLEAWGFRYITCLTWRKPSYGMGNYFRGQTEHVLFAVKGSQPLKRKDVGTIFDAPRGKGGHSSKPSVFFDLVQSCSPGPFLEMFGREDRKGWVVWGENG